MLDDVNRQGAAGACIRVNACRLGLVLLVACWGSEARAAPVADYGGFVRSYYGCVIEQTTRYSSTRETASDIADAALMYCRHWRTEALAAAALSDEWEHRFQETLEANARKGSILQTLATRHPTAAKSAGAYSQGVTDVGHAPQSAIQAAYVSWKSTMRSGGVSGVVKLSRECFKRAYATVAWADVDGCVALDKFAEILDDGMHSVAGTPAEPYFSKETVVARLANLMTQLPGAQQAKINRLSDVSQRAERLLQAEGPP